MLFSKPSDKSDGNMRIQNYFGFRILNQLYCGYKPFHPIKKTETGIYIPLIRCEEFSTHLKSVFPRCVSKVKVVWQFRRLRYL